MKERYRLMSLGIVLRRLGMVLAAGALVAYALWEARFLIAGPTLTLAAEPPTAQISRTVTIAGAARNISEITLNGRPIFTDKDGNFSEQVVLESGYTILTLRARDRYGREKILERPFVYVPAYEPFGHD